MATYQAFDVTKKVFITGAAGFIGFHLAKRLLEMGAVVLGFDNMNDYYDVSLKGKAGCAYYMRFLIFPLSRAI